MKFTIFISGLLWNELLGFFWVGDAFTYFELVYLPIVLLLMVLATFFIKQKDRRLSRSSGVENSGPSLGVSYVSSNSISHSPTQENSQGTHAEASDPAFNPLGNPANVKDIPRQIPA